MIIFINSHSFSKNDSMSPCVYLDLTMNAHINANCAAIGKKGNSPNIAAVIPRYKLKAT